jgi:hypothetical protein
MSTDNTSRNADRSTDVVGSILYSDLPTETQANILRFLSPHSLLDMSEVDRRSAVLSQNELWRKPCLRRPYPSANGTQSIAVVYNFTNMILANPVRAKGIRSLRILWRKVEEENIRGAIAVTSYIPPGYRNATRWAERVTGADILTGGLRARWAQALYRGSLDAMVAFLLLHLPGLQRLSVHFDKSLPLTTAVLKALAVPQQGSRHSILNLSYINLEGATDVGRWDQMPFITSWFLGFTNLRFLRLAGLAIPFHLLDGIQSSSLRYLDVSKSEIQADILASIILGCTHLEEVKALDVWYSSNTSSINPLDSQRYNILSTTLATCNLLTSLELREPIKFTAFLPSNNSAHDSNRITNLSRHTHLETLRIHCRIMPTDLGAALPSSLVTLYIDMDLIVPSYDAAMDSIDHDDDNEDDILAPIYSDSSLTSLDLSDLTTLSNYLNEFSKVITRFPALRRVNIALYPPQNKGERLLAKRIIQELPQHQTRKRFTDAGITFRVHIEPVPHTVP